MTYFLHNPNLAWLFPLLAAPVLLHLLVRARPPKYLFSATSFVQKVVRQAIRIKRPKDRLLLICRTLLFLTLFLIFLRPVVYFAEQLPGRDLPKNIVIIIDRSASMSWSEGGRSRFMAACDEAALLLDELSSRDTANVVWLDREPDAIFPEMGSNISYLRERLRDAACSHENGNAEQALRLAVSLLESRPGARELYILSDFQRSQWENVRFEVPDDINVSTLWSTRGQAENAAVLSIRTEPLSPLVGETTRVFISVGNFSATPRNQTVIVKIDEKRVTGEAQTPAWGHGVVALEHVFSKHGRVTIDARLEEDAFGMDDWQGALVPVRNVLRVGIAGEDSLTAPVLGRALRALPWVSATHMNSAPEKAEYDLVLLAGWHGEDLEAVSALKTQGIPLLISPAPNLSLIDLAALLDRDAPPDSANNAADAAVFLETLDKSVGLRINDETHPAFALFRDGAFGDPAHAAFTKRLRLDGAERLGKPLLSFADGQPALIECASAPTVMLWLAPLAPECGNWAAQAPFLPFFGELLGSMKGTKTIQLPQTWLPGDTLTFPTAPTFDNARLFDQADSEYAASRVDSVEAGTSFISEPIAMPGIYRVCTKLECTAAQIVNFPVSETDLRVAPPPVIAQSASNIPKNAAKLNAAREGMDLGKILIWAALALLGIESLLVLLLDADEQKMAKGSS